jgi:ABC-type transport system involved in multi-copper enzyme maturation permease subunit
MTARRLRLVAWHVFKESVRDRVLYAIAGFAVLLVGASLLIGELSAGQDIKIIKDLGLATIELAGVLMAVFIGVGLVSREIDRRSVFALLAKPLPRWEFIVGKYLGLVLTLAVNVWAMAAALFAVLAVLEWTSPANVIASWQVPAVDPRLAIQIVLTTAELALVTAVALFFSTFSSSALLSAAFTLGVFVAGLASADLRAFGEAVVAPTVGPVVSFMGWVVPAFSLFDAKTRVVHGQPIGGPVAVLLTLAYAAAYVGLLLSGAVAVFSRREFK